MNHKHKHELVNYEHWKLEINLLQTASGEARLLRLGEGLSFGHGERGSTSLWGSGGRAPGGKSETLGGLKMKAL